MSRSSFSGLTLEQLDLIDETAGRFEKQLKSGHAVDIDQFVASVPPELRHILRGELEGIQEELLSRNRSTDDSPAKDASKDDVTKVVGSYQIIETIGRGGMGVVYRARDTELQRDVALKMIIHGDHVTDRLRQRFLAEAAAVARLQHVNIVPVFSMGSDREIPYFAMELIEGGTLAEAIGEEPCDPEFAAALISVLADAIDYAHQNGIVHRDLKPSNVLLSQLNGTQNNRLSNLESGWRGGSNKSAAPAGAPGGLAVGKKSRSSTTTNVPSGREASRLNLVPKITDFGLARTLDTDSQLTGTGEVLGTPQYMSPEQARGDANVGPSTDIYALGAMLYRLLTGITPFRGETVVETLQAVLNAEPVSPNVIRPGLPIDLATISLKCLEKDPQRRYPSAGDLAADLHRWLRHEPIHARPATSTEKLLKWVRRRPVHAAAVLFAIILATGGPLVAINQARLRSEISEANESLETSNQSLTQQLYLAAMRQASSAVIDPRGGTRLRSLLQRWSDSDLKGWEWNHFHDRLNSTDSEILHQLDESIGAWARQTGPDFGELEAMGTGRSVSLFQTKPGQQRVLLWSNDPERGAIRNIAFSSDRKYVAAYTTAHQGVYIWDVASGEIIRRFNAEYNSTGFAWSPTDPELLFVNLVYEVGLVRLSKEEPLRKFRAPQNTRLAMTWARDGRGMYCAAHQGGIYFIPANPEEKVVQLLAYRTRFRSRTIDLSPDGLHLLIGDDLGVIRVFDIKGRQFRFTQPSHKGLVRGVAWSPDQKEFASVGDDGALLISEVRTGFQKSRRGHNGPIHGVAWTADQGLLTWGDDGTIRHWSEDPLDELDDLNGLTLTAVDWSPDGRRLIATGTELISIDFTNTEPTIELFNIKSSISTDVCWLPNGEDIALIFRDHVVTTPPRELLNIEPATFTRKLQEYTGYEKAWDLEISPTQPWVASAGSSGLMVYDYETGEEVCILEGKSIGSIAFTPDGSALLYANDKQMQLWNIKTDQVSPIGKAGTFSTRDPIRFHPGGSMFAVGTPVIHLVDYPSGSVSMRLEGHTGSVHCLEFSPDGHRLASGGSDNTIRIWDVQTGEEAAVLYGHHAQLTGISWTSNGETLASVDQSGSIRIWNSAEASP